MDEHGPAPPRLELRNAFTDPSAANRGILAEMFGEHAEVPSPGAPPLVPSLAAEIDIADERFNTFLHGASEIAAAVARGQFVADEQVGSALDDARAWVGYFGPHGPLCQGFPPHTPAQVYVDAVARVGQFQRTAQQWVDYFQPLWEKRSGLQQASEHDEELCLQQIAEALQEARDQNNSFAQNSSFLSSYQIEQDYVRRLNDLLVRVKGWSSRTARLAGMGRPESSQRLGNLIHFISDVQGTFAYTYRSRRAYEEFQRQQGIRTVPGGGGAGRPGPGSPEWFAAVTGLNCYWCGWSLVGVPKPVAICPHCGRIPTPS